MSLLGALFGSSKSKKEQKSASTTSLPQAPSKPEQDFVILQDSDFKKSPQHFPYPKLSDLGISDNSGPASLPTGHGVAFDTLPRQALDQVPFKLAVEKGSDDQSWERVVRSLDEIGARIETYEYDFKLEQTVISSSID